MKYTYDIAVLGAGSAGLVVAAGGAALGAKVLLIENALMGGDCLNYGCVPSKSFLHGAHGAGLIKSAKKYGILVDEVSADVQKLMEYVKSVISTIAVHDSVEHFTSLGVDVKIGEAELIDNHSLKINNESFSAKSIVIATGSRAFIPPIPGLSEIEYFTNHNIFNMETLPKSLVVLGGGPIGLELGQGFSHLGSKVSILDKNSSIFNKDEPEVAPIMQKKLTQDGINLLLDSTVTKIEKCEGGANVFYKKGDKEECIFADAVLVSTGRTPNTNILGLDKISVKLNERGYVVCSDKLQSSVKNIFACGDVAGPYLFTHTAGYQAGIVLQNALFGMSAKTNYSGVTWCTYTSPEVAHVGVLEKEATEKNLDIDTVFVSFSDNDRAMAEDDTDGFLKLILDKKGVIIGATVVSKKAGELISTAALAISAKLKISQFNSVILPYPTQAEIYKKAASNYRKEHVTSFQKKILKFLINRRNKR